ncbi:MAG: phosphoglycerate dehydrogenase [Flavobacteriia bacterium]|nr:phosphoglycerate dehydrogenase [Flavobacteriia bacterium]
MKKQKIYFLDKVHSVLESRLVKSGFECVDATHFNFEDLLEHKQDVFGIVLRSRFVLDEERLLPLSNLKFIARSGSGLENIDVNYCKQKNIMVFNSPEGNRNAVAEHALGMLLSLLNHLNFADQQVREGLWRREENRGEELDGKTIGIVGFGNTGSAFAKKLRGFDVKILVYDKYKTGFGDSYVQEATMEAIWKEADVISFHIPQNKETKGLVNKEFIRNFNKPIILLNLSRGKIVDTTDVIEALESGKIKSAGFDVLAYESKDFENLFSQTLPADFIKLTQMKQVILSPHVGGWTKESYFKLSNVLADKILEWSDNQ